MKYTILSLLLAVAYFHSPAQYNTNQNKIWTFGQGAGVDFNSGIPVSFPSAIVGGWESVASVSDNSGHLLFYSEGGRVAYDRAGHIIASGAALVPFATGSSTMGALIVPVLDNSNQYYLFTIEQWESAERLGRIAYSIIDMTLNGGYGDVIPSARGIVFDSNRSEGMIAVAGPLCNLWMVTHGRNNSSFYVNEITASGMGPKVAFPVDMLTDTSNVKMIKASPNGTTIAMANNAGVQLFDFNTSTGVISNARVLDSNGSYGVEFSPDGMKLYVQQMSTSTMAQYDLSLPGLSAIKASKTMIITASVVGIARNLKLAADDKIYFPMPPTELGCISSPNIAGVGCGVNLHAVDVAPNMPSVGLPNTYVNIKAAITGSMTICPGGSTTLSSAVPGGIWSSSNPAVGTIDATTGTVMGISTGTTFITYTLTGCYAITKLTVVSSPGPITGVTTACIGYTNSLSTSTPGGMWSSSDLSVATVLAGVFAGVSAGSAVISYSLAGGCPPVTTTVNIIPSLPPITGTASICKGNSSILYNTVPGGVWTRSTGVAYIHRHAGTMAGISTGLDTITYTLGNACNVTMVVTVNTQPTISGVPTLCAGQSYAFTATPTGGSWTTSDIGVAIVNTTTGNVTGVNAGTVQISYTSADGCVNYTHLTIEDGGICDTTATVEKITNGNGPLLIFPNPNNGNFSVYNSANEAVRICISNIVGKMEKEIYLKSGEKTEIDLNSKPGIYIVIAHTMSGMRAYKIIVH